MPLKLFIVFNRSDISQLVTLRLDSKPVSVLCQMGDFECGGGGWTPVMKINGNQVHIFTKIIETYESIDLSKIYK